MGSDPFESARLCDRIAALTVERDELKAELSNVPNPAYSAAYVKRLVAECDEAIRERDTAQRNVERWAAEARETSADRDALLKAIAVFGPHEESKRSRAVDDPNAYMEDHDHGSMRDGECPGCERQARNRARATAEEIAKRTGYTGGRGDG